MGSDNVRGAVGVAVATVALIFVFVGCSSVFEEGASTESELLRNGDFLAGFENWYAWQGGGSIVYTTNNGKLSVTKLTEDPEYRVWDPLIGQRLGTVRRNVSYDVQLTASSSLTGNRLIVVVQEDGVDSDGDGRNNTVYSMEEYALNQVDTIYQFTFVPNSTNSTSALKFFFGFSTVGARVDIAQVRCGPSSSEMPSLKPDASARQE